MSLGTMVQQILTDINRGSQHAPRVKQAIVDAIDRFSTKRLGWNQRRQEAGIVRGAEYVQLPEDWVEVAFVRRQDGRERYKLTERDYEWIEDRLTSDDYFGPPTDFTIQARQVRFYPIPDKSYSLVMMFQCRLPEVSISASDTATNAWMEEGAQLIRNWAQGEVMVKYIQGDAVSGGSQLVQYAEGTLLAELEAQAARESSTDTIRARL